MEEWTIITPIGPPVYTQYTRKSLEVSALKFATRAIHVGQEADPATGATVTPIYLSAIFTYDDLDRNKGYDYGRHGNPTRTALESCLASLEGGKHALVFSSGMAAVDAVLRLLRPADHVLLSEDVYGGTIRLIEEVAKPAGIQATYTDPDCFESAIQP